MKKMENNDVINPIINSKGQNSSNFKFQACHTNFAKIFREKNLSSLIEEVVDNKNENDYDKESKIAEYISFCDGEFTINETKPN
jgi:hypothetical protein